MNQQVLHQSQRQIERRARVLHQIPHDAVVLRILPFHWNRAQHRLQHIFLQRNFFHLGIRNFRRVQHRQRYQLRGIAYQDRPVLLAAAHRQRDPAPDVEPGNLLQRAVAPFLMSGTACFLAWTAPAAAGFPAAAAAGFPAAASVLAFAVTAAACSTAASTPASSCAIPMGWNGLSFSAASSAAFSSRYFMTVLSITSSGASASVAAAAASELVSRAASFFPISASSFGRRLAFVCNACNSRGELITRALVNKASTAERDPDTASASSGSSPTDGFSASAGTRLGLRFSGETKYPSTSALVFGSAAAARLAFSSHPASVRRARSLNNL